MLTEEQTTRTDPVSMVFLFLEADTGIYPGA